MQAKQDDHEESKRIGDSVRAERQCQLLRPQYKEGGRICNESEFQDAGSEHYDDEGKFTGGQRSQIEQIDKIPIVYAEGPSRQLEHESDDLRRG